MEYNKINFVIVGGGTAGWITALKLRKQFPENDITVIESSEIGILGAGEGTTPHFVDFLKKVDIDLFDFIKATKATLKTGIKFNNWNGDGSHYFHPFDDKNFNFQKVSHIVGMMEIGEGKNLNEICLSAVCSEKNSVPINLVDNEWNFDSFFALHFDARLTAEYLKSIARSRNVNLIDCKVKGTTLDTKGNISSIVLENGAAVECNFVFDCTGFRRMIIGDIFKTRWLDYQESLPVDRALPFFIQNNSNVIPPYTEAIAMKYGWVWKIPVQGRFGCGYVFDSDYASDEEIAAEIRDMFGDVEIPRFFSFKAGYYEDVWVNNCIAIGLSSGFIEPLEATSIWVSIRSLDFLIDTCLPGVFDIVDNEYKKIYNEAVRNINSEIKDFLQLHYLTSRNDSAFWREYRTKNKISNKLNYKSSCSVFDYITQSKISFPSFDPYYVNAGVKFFNKDVFKKHVDLFLKIPEYSNGSQLSSDLKREIEEYKNNHTTDHFLFLKSI